VTLLRRFLVLQQEISNIFNQLSHKSVRFLFYRESMKKFFVIPFLFCAAVSFSQTQYLIPYRDGNLWGYADTNLNVVVKPKYDHVNFFHQGYATVLKGNKWGIFNSNGKEIKAPQYDGLYDCCYEYQVVKKNNKSGIISLPDGQTVLAVNYRSIFDIGDFRYLPQGEDLLKGLFDARAKRWLLPVRYRNVTDIGKSIYIIESENFLKGVYNTKTKKWLLPIEFDDISYGINNNFVATKKDETIYFNFYAKTGFAIQVPPEIEPEETQKMVVDSIFPEVEMLVESSPNLEQTIISSSLNLDQRDNWKFADSYTRNGKTGYRFSEKKNGVVTLDSIPAIFDDIRWAVNNLYIVRKEGKEGIVTEGNKEIVPIIYDTIKGMVKGMSEAFIVKKSGKEGVVSVGNEEIVPIMYDEVKDTDSTDYHGIYIVKNNLKYGLTTATRLLLECSYDYIIEAHGSFEGFRLYKDEKEGAYITSKEEWLKNIFIPPKYDYIKGLLLMKSNQFDSKIPFSEGDKTGKFLLNASRDNKQGYIDFYGKEFFKN